jgi:hypothetical protein
MEDYQLVKEHSHLFLMLDGERWLLDTGSPVSFGNREKIAISGVDFQIPHGYMGMNIESVSNLINVSCRGLLGVDILNNFDVIFDLPCSRMTLSGGKLDLEGARIPLEFSMGVPVIDVKIHNTSWRMVFDSGAQVSYYEDERIRTFPPAGQFVDFFPGIGGFTVDAYHVRMQIGTTEYQLSCGSLPGLLGMALGLLNVDGVLGNEICSTNRIGYFPKREQLVIG